MKENIEIKDSEGNLIDGTLSVVDNDFSKPIMLLCHGLTVNKENSPFPELEKALNSLDVSTLRIDLFGHGKSEGLFENLTITKGIDTIRSSFQYLSNRGFRKIGLLGESFGGICSTIFASETNDLFCLILKSPVSDYLEVERLRRTEEELFDWQNRGFIIYKNSFGEERKMNYSFYEDFSNYDVFTLAKKIEIPTLVIHGDKDKTVPMAQSKKLVSNFKFGQLKIFKNVGHKFIEQSDIDDMLILISNFVVENIKK